MCYLPSFIHVTSPFYSLAVGHASVQLDALVVKASLFDSIASGLQSSDLVNIRVCWDSDRVIRRFKRGESHSRRWCPYGRRPGPPCYPDDCKCQLGCRRRCYAQGKYHVSEGSRQIQRVDGLCVYNPRKYQIPNSTRGKER